MLTGDRVDVGVLPLLLLLLQPEKVLACPCPSLGQEPRSLMGPAPLFIADADWPCL